MLRKINVFSQSVTLITLTRRTSLKHNRQKQTKARSKFQFSTHFQIPCLSEQNYKRKCFNYPPMEWDNLQNHHKSSVVHVLYKQTWHFQHAILNCSDFSCITMAILILSQHHLPFIFGDRKAWTLIICSQLHTIKSIKSSKKPQFQLPCSFPFLSQQESGLHQVCNCKMEG